MKDIYERIEELEKELPAEQLYENLTIKNDFMFGKVMEDAKLCVEMLSLLTGTTIKDTIVVSSQKSIKITNASKGVRYDIYVDTSGDSVYNTEMQQYHKTTDKCNLPKRVRYYQSAIDNFLLDKGNNYEDLKSSYVIVICCFDPFGKGLFCYKYRNLCENDDLSPLEDGRTILFFNTCGIIKNVSDEVISFLKYIETGIVTTDYTARINKAVKKAKVSKDWRFDYMKTLLHDKDIREDGIEIGTTKTLINLICKKIEKHKSIEEIADDLEKEVSDIEHIYTVATNFSPNLDVDAIYDELKK